jgi:uncharacterized membrane protein
MTVGFQTTIDIGAPSTVVWDVLIDVTTSPEWTDSISAVERLDGGPLRIGSNTRIKQPGFPAVTWQVTELDPGVGFTWVAHSLGSATTGRHQLTSTAEGGTRVTLAIEQRGALASIVGKLTAKRIQRYLRMEAEGLKARSEQRHRDAGNTS